MSLKCGRCGSEMPGRRYMFWCGRCDAYFCEHCLGPTGKCPHCNRERLGSEQKKFRNYIFLAIGFALVFLVIMGAAGIWALQSSGSTDLTRPADARPGTFVRVFGQINTSAGVAFSAQELDDHWAVLNYSLFLLVDPADPASNITVDVGSCDDFSYSRLTPADVDVTNYSNGDRITVSGNVITNTSGERVLYATKVRAGKSGPPNLVNLIATIAIPVAVLALAGVYNAYRSARRRRRRHWDFVRRHAGKEWKAHNLPSHGVAGIQRAGSGRILDRLGPPISPEWIPNGRYIQFRRNTAIFISIVSVLFASCLLYLLMFGIADAGGTALAVFGLLLFGSALFPAAFMGYVNLNWIPVQIAITSPGIYIRYRKREPADHLIRSLGWSDIQKVLDVKRIMEDAYEPVTMLSMKVDGRTRAINIDKRLRLLILREWCRHNPDSDEAKECAKYAK